MSQTAVFWRPTDQGKHIDRADQLDDGDIYKPEYFEYAKSTLTALSDDLRTLGMDIHGVYISEHTGFGRLLSPLSNRSS